MSVPGILDALTRVNEPSTSLKSSPNKTSPVSAPSISVQWGLIQYLQEMHKLSSSKGSEAGQLWEQLMQISSSRDT